MYKPNDNYYKEFTTANPATGAAADADSTPSATANHNGSDDGSFALTVAKIDTGRYKITGTVPSGYVKGDVVNVSVAATCSSVAGKACVDTFGIDSKRIGDLNDLGGVAQTGDAFARIGAAGAGLTSVVLAAAGTDEITIETGINLRQSLALALSTLVGKASGLDTNAPVYKGANNNTTRVAALTDASGNRTSVTLTPPS